ncbi:MAG TPA: universal stress protein [Streptosporangiaceae bacterium]|nr:universal stress protein [Streptosporangiaceae bacterium]
MSDTRSGAAGRIVVGVDGSPAADEALRWAVAQATRTGDTVQATIAWQYPISVGGYGWAPTIMDDNIDFASIATKTVAEAVNRVSGADSTVTIAQRVVEGYAPQILTEASAGADLLVVGSRGHGTFADALLGSVSQHCAHHAKCPVVIVRGHAG